MPTVVGRDQNCTHYIGRPSIFGNKYSHLKWKSNYPVVYVETREEAIRRYEIDMRKDIKLMKAIYELPENAILGCWCKPKACHGDVIVKLWEELHRNDPHE